MSRREEIIAAARTVFAREGFRGATMDSIATEAGMKTPSHIYWYFKSKQELLQAVVEDLSPVLQNLSELWKRIDDPPEELLDFLTTILLSTLDNPETKQLAHILVTEAPRVPETANTFAEKAILVLHFLASYLERQQEKGILRKHNPQASSRALIGAFLLYMIGTEVFPPMKAGLPSRGEYQREILDIFMNGLRTREKVANSGEQPWKE